MSMSGGGFFPTEQISDKMKYHTLVVVPQNTGSGCLEGVWVCVC